MKGVNVFGIYSLISAYEECEDWLFELLIYLEKNKNFLEDFIAKNIPNLKVVKAEATYLLWIDISSLNKLKRVYKKTRRARKCKSNLRSNFWRKWR
jgi:cystathionine beta-lyase